MRSSFDLNDVRIFVAAAQSKSMSAAGRVLQIPTSSVSRGVARLEKHMSIQLVNRESHGIALTEAGSDYLKFCVEALATLRDGGQQVMLSKDSPEGLLRIACPALMSQQIFAPLIATFLQAHPRLQLEILPYHPQERETRPVSADLAFELKAPNNLRTLIRRYPSVRRGIYAAKSYLSTVASCKVPEDLLRCDCIGSRAASHLSQWLLVGPGGSTTVEPKFKTLAADPALLRAMVLSGLGITILPVWMAMEPDPKAELVRVLPDWEPVPVPLFACVPFGSTLLPGTRVLLEFFDRHLGTASDPRLTRIGADAGPLCFQRRAD